MFFFYFSGIEFISDSFMDGVQVEISKELKSIMIGHNDLLIKNPDKYKS